MERTKTFDEHTVLDKAVHLFWEKGFLATSAEDLVSTLGICRASLYDIYGDKRELFIKSLKKYIAEQSEPLISFLLTSDDAKSNIAKVFNDIIVADNAKYGCLIGNTSVEFSGQDLEIQSLIENNNDKIVNALSTVIKKSQTNGKMSNKTNSDNLAQFIFNNILGLWVSLRAGTSGVYIHLEIFRFTEQSINIVCQGLRELKRYLIQNAFPSQADEIRFFKEIKPSIYKQTNLLY